MSTRTHYRIRSGDLHVVLVRNVDSKDFLSQVVDKLERPPRFFRPGSRTHYDPISLKMRSCLGWSEADLIRKSEVLQQQAVQQGGHFGEFFWIFPPALATSFA